MTPSSPQGDSDAIWLDQLRRGEGAAHAELHARLTQIIRRRLGRQQLRDPEQLLELAADRAYDRVVKKLASFRGESSLIQWARPFAHHALSDLLSEEARLPTDGFGPGGEADEQQIFQPADPSPTPDEQVVADEDQRDPAREQRNRAVSECFATLSEAEQAALEAYTLYSERLRTTQYRERQLRQLEERRARARGAAPAEAAEKQKYDDALRSEQVREIATRFGVTTRTIYRYTEPTYKRSALVKMRDCLAGKGYSFA